MSSEIPRTILPVPDRDEPGPTILDAKDPAATFPPIEPLRPPAGAPNVLVVLLDDVGFGASSAFGGPVRDAERRAAGRRAASSTTASTRRRSARRRARRCSPAATTTPSAWAASPRSPPRRRATTRCGRTRARRSRETLKLNGYSTAQFGKCHEVPVWETSPMGPFDAWPTGGGGFEYFYGFIGGETNQYYPALYEGTAPIEPTEDARGGLPLHRGHDRQGDHLGAPAEGAHAGQAVLRLLRARRDARAAPRARGVVGEVQGPVRRGLGRAARGDARPPEGARRHPAGRRADRRGTTRSRPGTTCPTSSSRCSRGRWRSTPASSSTPTTTSAGSIDALDDLGDPRRHARLLHHRRQRRERRGHDQRHASTS